MIAAANLITAQTAMYNGNCLARVVCCEQPVATMGAGPPAVQMQAIALPKDRAEGCEDEYAQVDKAFRRLIGPHIDLEVVKENRDRGLVRNWLPAPATKLNRLGESKR
jgi:hypothetical protein